MSDPSVVFSAEFEAIGEGAGLAEEIYAAKPAVTTNGNGATLAPAHTNGSEPSAAPAHAETAVAIEQPIRPIEPRQPQVPGPYIPPLKKLVSGRYRSSAIRSGFMVELRVDVDGRVPLRKISADYYSVSGATITYYGSMIVDSPTITATTTSYTIRGTGRYTWSAGAPVVTVTIPRISIFGPGHGDATLRHSTIGGAPGATYVCRYESPYFRTVDLEEDVESGVAPFIEYDTSLLPSGGSPRKLTTASAYAEAGIEMRISPKSNIVHTVEAGANAIWSNAELHASMVSHFSLYKETAQWAVWLFHARRHDLGSGLLGIMFDQQGLQRQGAATFYGAQGGTAPSQLRNQLYTCVHELGHCFNLFHSFHKTYMNPPQPNRPDSLSWMNYPYNYTGGSGGEAAFWSAFPFQFDALELAHLRHGFRNNVIMGGANFGIGAALEEPGEWQNEPVVDNSGLKLTLRAPKSFMLGAPVSVELELSVTDLRGKLVQPRLNPSFGFVDIAIVRPSKQVVIYQPPFHQCSADEPIFLGDDRTAISEMAYIGYGKGGFYFDQEGFYQIRARYYALDGSLVLSNPISIRIRSPLKAEDEAVAELFMGDEQGMLLSLMGSDALSKGNAAFDEVLERYAKHPLADYARLVKGVNAAREFKIVRPDGNLTVRPPQPDAAAAILAPVMNVDEGAVLGGDPAALEGPDASPQDVVAMVNQQHATPQLRAFVRAQSPIITAEIRS